MSGYIHKELAAGRWFKMSFAEQMANVGSEVERALARLQENRPDECRRAADRALELMEMTMADDKNRKMGRRLAELARIKEVLADYFYSDNKYLSTQTSWKSYFGGFGFYAARKRGL